MNKDLDMKLYRDQARRLSGKSKSDKAIVTYKRLIRIDPQSYAPHYFWARILNIQENYRSSELKLREVLIMDPEDTFALSNMGTSLLNQGKYDQAISFLKRGLEIRPDHCEMIYDLAVAVTKKGEYEEAMELCERGVNVNPHSTFLHNWMGYLYFIQGKYQDAILKFDRGIQTFRGYEMSYFNKTLVLSVRRTWKKKR